jgi:hypothetical protein
VITNLNAPVPTATTLTFPAPNTTASPCSVTVAPQERLRQSLNGRKHRAR